MRKQVCASLPCPGLSQRASRVESGGQGGKQAGRMSTPRRSTPITTAPESSSSKSSSMTRCLRWRAGRARAASGLSPSAGGEGGAAGKSRAVRRPTTLSHSHKPECHVWRGTAPKVRASSAALIHSNTPAAAAALPRPRPLPRPAPLPMRAPRPPMPRPRAAA